MKPLIVDVYCPEMAMGDELGTIDGNAGPLIRVGMLDVPKVMVANLVATRADDLKQLIDTMVDLTISYEEHWMLEEPDLFGDDYDPERWRDVDWELVVIDDSSGDRIELTRWPVSDFLKQ